MEIILKRNWDIPVGPPDNDPNNNDNEGFFIGRGMEIELLKNEIKRKDQGSVLISGHRGVGKTTLVYKVLKDLYNEQRLRHNEKDKEMVDESVSSKKMFVVLINAGQLESIIGEKDKKITPEAILKTLIRRLYSTGKSFLSDECKSDLEVLYKKAIAKEYKSQENIRQQLEHIISSEKRKEFNIQLKEFDKSKIIHLISFLLGTAVLGAKFLGETLSKVIAMILALPLPWLKNYSISHVRTKQTKLSDSNSAELLYQMDNDVANLEYDLEELHKKLNLRGYKIVYVIDELDKLGDINKVAQVIKYFKNLFTLSKAIFIFIGNEDIYQSSIVEYDGKLFRPEQYTYFSSKFFISRPTFKELQSFLDNSIDVPPLDSKVIDLVRLEHYLAQEAGNDFYNLINIMKNNIQKYTEKGNPILSININNPDNLKKSRFHKCQVLVFNEKYFVPTIAKRYDNEKLLRELMAYGVQIISANPKENFVDPNDPDTISSIKRDFNNLLLKLEVFSIKTESVQNINGIDVPIRHFNYTGYFKKDPPDRLNVLSEYEKRFMGLSSEYLKMLLPIINEFKKKKDDFSLVELEINVGAGNDINEILPFEILKPDPNWQSIFKALNEEPPMTIRTVDEVESQERELKERMARISNSLFPLTVQILRSKTLEKLELVKPSTDKRPLETYEKELFNATLSENAFIFSDIEKKKLHILFSDTFKINLDFLNSLNNNYKLYFIRTGNKNKNEELLTSQKLIKKFNVYTITDTVSLIKETNKMTAQMLSRTRSSKLADTTALENKDNQGQSKHENKF